MAVEARARDELDQGSRHRIRMEPEVSLRERIEPRALHADVEAGLKPHGVVALQVLLEAREQLLERALSTCQKRVNVPALRCPGAVKRVCRQRVALDDDHTLEIRHERSC